MRKRTQVTARSGFTHIRVCNDCKQPIDQDDRCNCTTLTPFIKGTEVTVVSSGVPIRLAVVGRLGNGAFRLENDSMWWALGRATAFPVSDPTSMDAVRIRKPEDGPYIEAVARAKKLLSDVARTLQQINDLSAKALRQRAEERAYSKDAAYHEKIVAQIDVAALSETARLAAAAKFTKELDLEKQKATDSWQMSKKSRGEASITEAEIKRLREGIEALPADVKTVLNLGGIEALSSYVVPQ